jgi:TolB protein
MGALDKMWEPIDAPPPPGMSAESWNKAGRAFDIISDLNAGYNPVVEIAREQSGAKTWWRVYVRTKRQDGSQGAPLHVLPWNFQARYSGNISDYEDGGRVKASVPPGYYVDFTQMAADYGWDRVPAGATWRTNFPATLYWHFEKRQGLEWESAMLELYPAQDLDSHPESSTP